MPMQPTDTSFERRDVLTGLAIAGLGLSALPDTAEAKDASLSIETPAENLRAIVRTTASLKEVDCPYYYNGTIYGVVGEEQPRPLYKFTGLEIYRMLHIAPDEYELIGNTVTFFRDLETNAFLYDYANPYTGAKNTVPAAVQGGGAGRGFEHSVRGIRPKMFKDKFPDEPLKMWWTAAGDYLWLHDATVYPPGMQAPRMQRKTNFVRRDQFLDPKVDSLAAMFTAAVFMPWPKWMEMGDRPGHIVWHASGAKVKSIADVPAEHRERAIKEHPERLSNGPA
jgi:Protein of unknown function (DUF1838)